ncbi:G-type lectin S-receptor-like serine/threonine-protein kinase SD2-5 [Platanthera guangdongensis]|uniref:Receptor-like serine/threonine-protein kinase n=1 Tax=Platanthera guangdongensis TaxID=2320717 RepID=A0ABR2M234_9ASPA
MAGASLFLLFFTSAISIFLPLISAQFFAHREPTANLSTVWTINPPLSPNLTYPDGSAVFPLLICGSSGPSFSFGFYCTPPCNAFLLSIFIVNTNRLSEITLNSSDLPQVVWSANRNLLVGLNATAIFSANGDLILLDANGIAVWSTNTSGHGANTLTLTDSGNLLILDPDRRNIWASFDHPTDSLLLGQSLKEGHRLTANSSATNTTSGQLYIAVLDGGLAAFVDSSPPQLYFSNGFTNPPNRSAVFVTFNNGSLDIFALFTQPGVPDMYITLPSSSSHQYMRFEDDGHLKLYGWSGGWKFLKDVLDVFPDDCAYPTVCGQYGICLNGQCSCPQAANGDSSFFKPVNPLQINLGCRVSTPISCEAAKSQQLLALNNVSYFNYLDPSTASIQEIDRESCKQACLRNCSCKAALFQYGPNASSGSCYLPSQIFSLMSNRPEITHYNSSSFLKVQTTISNPPPAGPFQEAMPGSRSWRKKLVIGLLVGFILAGLLLMFIILCVRRRRRGQKLEEEDKFDEVPGMVCRYSYEELKSATKNFEEKLGQGGFGTVFKGTLSNGVDIAVKRLDDTGEGKEQFLAEVETIGSVHHINLVSLIGFCVEKSHKLLVLEYIPNGSLDTWIFGEKATALDWKTRQNIIFDIAKGLSYLHEECRQKIAHLDIKPQNILLDQNFNAKVGDFGLAKLIDRDQSEIMTRMRGTPGYLAPEWLTSIITEKADVYSFGVVVLEVICGRKNLDPSQLREAGYLIALVQEKLKDNLLEDLFDKHCSDMEAHKEEALETMRLAIWCLQIDSSRRPSMSTVVKVLEGSSDVHFDIDSDLLVGSGPFM